MPTSRRAPAQAVRRALRRNASLAVLLVAGAGVLWLVRPGAVTNGVRSPVLWLVVVGAVVAAKLLGLLVRRLSGSTAAGTAASVAVALAAAYVLLAPSFTQRTLEEPFPDLEPLAAAPQAPAPAVEPSPGPAAQSRPASTPTPVQAAPLRPQGAVVAPSPAAPRSRPVPRRAPERPVEAQTPPPPALPPSPPSAPSPTSAARSTPAPAEASPDRQVSVAGLEGVGHSATGRTSFYEVDGGKVLRFEDVDIEGTPGPFVHLVPRGARSPDGGVRVGVLKAEKGSFSYRLPASVDLRQDWTVLVWCEPYDTPIAASDH